jgi:hypothetical protein
MTIAFLRRLSLRHVGTFLCAAGLALVALPSLIAAALGVESLAAAFWLWGRAAPDATEQVPRWAWLRRPATALWLATAARATLNLIGDRAPMSGSIELVRWVEALATLWAGLELLAALPLARPYSDLPGPFLAIRPWLPVLLPATGFLVLWRQSPHWIEVASARQFAIPLLLLTSLLASLRALSRRQWIASLRWLVVSDCSLASLVVAGRVLPSVSILLLWLGACGAHAFLLAGELRGASTRRGPFVTRLWRLASWVALGSLAWPALTAVGFGEVRAARAIYFAAGVITTMLAAWITVGRIVSAPERRMVMRPDPALTLSQIAGIAVLGTGPLALTLAWWSGFEPSWRATISSLVPTALGGAGALLARQTAPTVRDPLRRLSARMPGVAGFTYNAIVGLERRAMRVLESLGRAMTSALHDLHTGDAQEYLLFLVGLGVLALVLPLLQ